MRALSGNHQAKELDGTGLIKLQEYCLPWVLLRQRSRALKAGREVSGGLEGQTHQTLEPEAGLERNPDPSLCSTWREECSCLTPGVSTEAKCHPFPLRDVKKVNTLG